MKKKETFELQTGLEERLLMRLTLPLRGCRRKEPPKCCWKGSNSVVTEHGIKGKGTKRAEERGVHLQSKAGQEKLHFRSVNEVVACNLGPNHTGEGYVCR